ANPACIRRRGGVGNETAEGAGSQVPASPRESCPEPYPWRVPRRRCRLVPTPALRPQPNDVARVHRGLPPGSGTFAGSIRCWLHPASAYHGTIHSESSMPRLENLFWRDSLPFLRSRERREHLGDGRPGGPVLRATSRSASAVS